jgi:hypothetical protein
MRFDRLCSSGSAGWLDHLRMAVETKPAAKLKPLVVVKG